MISSVYFWLTVVAENFCWKWFSATRSVWRESVVEICAVAASPREAVPGASIARHACANAVAAVAITHDANAARAICLAAVLMDLPNECDEFLVLLATMTQGSFSLRIVGA